MTVFVELQVRLSSDTDVQRKSRIRRQADEKRVMRNGRAQEFHASLIEVLNGSTFGGWMMENVDDAKTKERTHFSFSL